jgi:hypothetical protein
VAVSGAGWPRRGAHCACECEADLVLRFGVCVGRWRFSAACMAARRRRKAPTSNARWPLRAHCSDRACGRSIRGLAAPVRAEREKEGAGRQRRGGARACGVPPMAVRKNRPNRPPYRRWQRREASGWVAQVVAKLERAQARLERAR